MAKKAAPKVQELIIPVVEGLGYEFIGAEYLAAGKHSVLRIYIDNPDGGVKIDDCEKVSRQVSSVLYVEDPISGRYMLEVSSPGLDRLLFTEAHYQRFTGRQVKIRLKQMIDGRRKMTAELKACEDGVITVEVDGVSIQVKLSDIDQARLIPVFD